MPKVAWSVVMMATVWLPLMRLPSSVASFTASSSTPTPGGTLAATELLGAKFFRLLLTTKFCRMVVRAASLTGRPGISVIAMPAELSCR